MPADTDPIVNGLLKWWQRRFPMAQGQRNQTIFKLAAAFNNYGIPYTRALDVCLPYAEPTGPDPFTEREITRTVESAYRSTEHGSKQWRGGHGGHAPRPAYTPRLTPAQTQAMEDRLVEEFRARFAWKPWSVEPQPAAEVGAAAAPAPAPAPPTAQAPAPIEAAPQPIPAPPKSRARLAIERMAAKNPEINLLVDMLDLDLSRAQLHAM